MQEILFQKDAKEKLLKGIEKIAELAFITYGPKSKNIGLHSHGFPSVSNDTLKIITETDLKDPFEDMGAFFAKEVYKTVYEEAGDCATAALIIFFEIVKEATLCGGSFIKIKKELEEGLKTVLSFLEKIALPIERFEDQSRLSKEIEQTLSKAFSYVGNKGIVLLKNSEKRKTEIRFIEGTRIEKGYESSHFCTDKEKLFVEMQNPYLLIADKKIRNITDLLPILQQAAYKKAPLVIIAHEFSEEVLSFLVTNKLKKNLRLAAVRSPSFGEDRKNRMEELALLTGGKLITENSLPKEIGLLRLGKCEKIIIKKDQTLFLNGAGEKKEIQNRIDLLKNEYRSTSHRYDKEKIQKRIDLLTGKIAEIHIGAETESSLKHQKNLFQKKLKKAYSAFEKGVLPGGGTAFFHAANQLPEEGIGFHILRKALKAPYHLLMKDEKEKIINYPYGLNFQNGKIEDLYKAKITDPLQAAETALKQSIKIASLVLSADVLIQM